MAGRVRFASTQEQQESLAARSVEVRVHGIGDHQAWSSLGAPRLVNDDGSSAVDIALPPSVDHEVRLLGWTRTGRRKTGPLWYLALPFSLVNVTHVMRPPVRGWRLTTHRIATAVASGAMTIAATLWLIAIAETVVRYLGAWVRDAWAVPIVVVLVAGALLLTVWLRGMRTPNEVSGATKAVHSTLILFVAAWVWSKPVQIVVPPDLPAWLRMFVTPGPAVDGSAANHLDPLTAGTAAMILAVALAAWVLTLAASGRGEALTRSAMAGTAMAMVAAIWILTAVASATRLAVDQLAAYLARHLGATLVPPSARAVLPYQGSDSAHDDWVIDLAVLAALAALLFLLLSLLVEFRVSRLTAGTRDAPSGAGGAIVVHNAITGLRDVLLPAMRTAIPVASVGVVLLLAWLVNLGSRSFGVVVMLVQAAAFLLVITLVLGRTQVWARDGLGSVADIIGFWPVRGHPLAGVAYRDDVVGGIAQELAHPRDGTLVLVAHSQGSVLAAWTLSECPPPAGPRGGVHLVTCGSPIDSLYRTFFPTAFTIDRLKRVREATNGRWTNFWRHTDPIATAMPQGLASDHLLEDPTADGSLLGHSDYWTDAEQLEAVGAALSANPPQEEAGSPPGGAPAPPSA